MRKYIYMIITYKNLCNKNRHVEEGPKDKVQKMRNKNVVGDLEGQERNLLCEDAISLPNFVGKFH